MDLTLIVVFIVLVRTEMQIVVFHIGRKLLIDQDPVIITDVWDDTPLACDFRELFGDQVGKVRSKDCSWMGIPLTSNGRVIGVQALQHNIPFRRYSPKHVDLVLGFANQATVAIETAQHYEQARALTAIEERQRLARDLHE